MNYLGGPSVIKRVLINLIIRGRWEGIQSQDKRHDYRGHKLESERMKMLQALKWRGGSHKSRHANRKGKEMGFSPKSL